MQFQLQLPSPFAPQRLVHPLARILHLERGYVGIALRRRHPGVAEHLLHNANVHTLLDQQSRGRMPAVVDPDVPDLRLAQDGLPGPPVLGAFNRGPAPGREH